jgi:hypothetical protein
MKYLEIIADNLSKSGWSWGCVSAIDSQGRTMWIVDAHRDGKRFIVRANEKLTAFMGAGNGYSGFAKSNVGLFSRRTVVSDLTFLP